MPPQSPVVSAAEPAPRLRNVLFLVLDDQAPLFGSYGRQAGFAPARTPSIDRFAAEGSLFETAYAQAPTCGASRASLMTSLYATTDRFMQFDTWAEREAPGVTDLPTALQNAGYITLSSGKIYHKRLDNEQSWHEVCGFGSDIPRCSYDKGMCCRLVRPVGRRTSEEGEEATVDTFAEFAARESVDLSAAKASYYEYIDAEEDDGLLGLSAFARNGPTCGHRGLPCRPPAVEAPDVDDYALPDGKLTKKVIGDIRLAKKEGTPFFIAAGYNRPHLPFAAPKRYWDMYNRSQITLARNPFLPEGAPAHSVNYFELRTYGSRNRQQIPEYYAGTGGPSGGALAIPDNLARELIHGYYACTSYIDALIGDLLRELRAQAMYDDTIITLTSDHGYHLGNKGTWCKHTLYETALHVPMIVKVHPAVDPTGPPPLKYACAP